MVLSDIELPRLEVVVRGVVPGVRVESEVPMERGWLGYDWLHSIGEFSCDTARQ